MVSCLYPRAHTRWTHSVRVPDVKRCPRRLTRRAILSLLVCRRPWWNSRSPGGWPSVYFPSSKSSTAPAVRVHARTRGGMTAPTLLEWLGHTLSRSPTSARRVRWTLGLRPHSTRGLRSETYQRIGVSSHRVGTDSGDSPSGGQGGP